MAKLLFAALLIGINTSQFLLLNVNQIRLKVTRLLVLFSVMLIIGMILNYWSQQLFLDVFIMSVGLMLILTINYAIFKFVPASRTGQIEGRNALRAFFSYTLPLLFVILLTINQCLSLFWWNQ